MCVARRDAHPPVRSAVVARYRPVDVRLWNDRRFLALPDDLKLLWMFLLTTPSTLAIPGVVVGGPAALSEQLGWTAERFAEGLLELMSRGMKVRTEGRVIWLSNALKYQPPESPNALRGWSKCWDDIPEGELKTKIWDALRIACKSKGASRLKLFTEAFPKVWGEGYAQPSLELWAPGSGSGTRSETGSRSRPLPPSSSQLGLPAGLSPDSPEDLRPEPKSKSEPDNEPERPALRVVGALDELVELISTSHMEAYELVRVKHAIAVPAMTAPPRSEVRALLNEIPLDGARDQCLHVIAVRKVEAERDRSMKWFGAGMWQPHVFNNSTSRTIDDVLGRKAAPKRERRPEQQELLTDPKTFVQSIADMDDPTAQALAASIAGRPKDTP
jgi:hypothetical protein